MKILALALALAAGCATAPEAVPTHHDHELTELDLERPEVIAFQAPLELTHSTAALSGPANNVPGFQFTCTSTRSRIQASTDQVYWALWVWAGTNSGGASTTPAFIGDRNVTTTNGMPLCSGNCPAADAKEETRDLWCVTASTSVSLTVQVGGP